MTVFTFVASLKYAVWKEEGFLLSEHLDMTYLSLYTDDQQVLHELSKVPEDERVRHCRFKHWETAT